MKNSAGAWLLSGRGWAMQNSFYREIINDHNIRPAHKHMLPAAELEHRGINPGCGDDITLQLDIENGIIQDGAFTGSGCAISQASADMMLDLVIGKSTEEALRLSDIFMRMIKGGASEEEIREIILADEKLAPELSGKTIKKLIIVPGRLINVII